MRSRAGDRIADATTFAAMLAVMAVLSGERLVELAINRRHAAWLRARGARFVQRDGFGLILAAQVLLFTLLPLEVALAPWPRLGWWTWVGLALVVLANGLRYWVIATLGPRWCIRVATLPGAPRIVTGPYRLMRHPNYLAVGFETLALPLAFGTWGTLLLVLPFKLVALTRRIRIEERALSRDAEGRASHTS